jgi:hypothetical protein
MNKIRILQILKHLVNLVTLLLLLSLPAEAQPDLTRFVNPFIGTAGHGHTFPGAIVSLRDGPTQS